VHGVMKVGKLVMIVHGIVKVKVGKLVMIVHGVVKVKVGNC